LERFLCPAFCRCHEPCPPDAVPNSDALRGAFFAAMNRASVFTRYALMCQREFRFPVARRGCPSFDQEGAGFQDLRKRGSAFMTVTRKPCFLDF
jgi:hypothetical protein